MLRGMHPRCDVRPVAGPYVPPVRSTPLPRRCPRLAQAPRNQARPLYLGSMFSLMCASADSLNFAVAFVSISAIPTFGSCGAMRPGTPACAFLNRLLWLASLLDLPSLRVAR